MATLAAFQGGFDIFRGGVDVLRGTVEAQRALSAATSASAAAEAARGAAVASTGAAATAATPSLVAMNVALGPVGIAVLGIGAALATGVTLWRNWGDEGEDAGQRAADASEEARGRHDALREAINASINAANDLNSIGERRRGLLGPSDRISAIDREIGEEQNRTISGFFTAGDFFAQRNRIGGQSGLERIGEARGIFENIEGLIRERQRVGDRQFRINESSLEQQIRSQKGVIDQETRTQDAIATQVGRLRPGELRQFERLRADATDEDGATNFRPEQLRQLAQLVPAFGGDIERRELARRGGREVDPEGNVVESAERLDRAREQLANLESTIDELRDGNERRQELEAGNLQRVLGVLEGFARRIAEIENENLRNGQGAFTN